MPYIDIGGPSIFYERAGKGKPLVLLNGIMMSTASWKHHIERLKGDFDLIAIDFRDQGRSSKMEGEYDLSIHSGDLAKVLEDLGIEKTHLLGVSYGAHVAEDFTLRHPEMVDKLIISNAVDRTDAYLKELGRSWEAAAQTHDAELFFKVALPSIYSRTFYNSNLEWINSRIEGFKTVIDTDWLDAFVRLSKSGAGFDLSEEVRKISASTLLMCAEEDIVTSKRTMEAMHEKIENSRIVSIPLAGHAAFLERQDLFCDIVKGFLL